MERDYAEIRNYVLASRFGLVRPAVIRCIILSQKSLTRIVNSAKIDKPYRLLLFWMKDGKGISKQFLASEAAF